jgi:hypothetical protein
LSLHVLVSYGSVLRYRFRRRVGGLPLPCSVQKPPGGSNEALIKSDITSTIPLQFHFTRPMETPSTFSFTAPSSASINASALKHRRVSLASQSSPRVVQAWNFRDDTGLDSQASNGQLVPEKKGKMRKIDVSQVGDDSSSSRVEKKPRKKWTEEETMMLVEGCQTVSTKHSSPPPPMSAAAITNTSF